MNESIRETILKACPKWKSDPDFSSSMSSAEEVIIIQMELFDLNLKTFLRGRKTDVQVDVSLRIFLDILAGMAQLHTRRDVILHRDLKPSNIFLKVSDDGRI